MADTKGVLIVAEVNEANQPAPISAELLGIGRQLADGLGQPLTALVLGSGVADAAKALVDYGADHVLAADDPALKDYQPDAYVKVVGDVCQEQKPHIVLLGRTNIGRDLAPRVAFRLNAGLAVDCTELSLESASKRLVATRPVYGGNAVATVVCPQEPQIATIRPKAFAAVQKDEGRKGEIRPVQVKVDPSILKYKLVSRSKAQSEGGVRMEDATVIVAGGRGLGGPEPFKQLDELAKLLKGAVGASRAVCDAGWVPVSYQIGLTGKTVSPDLYITVAISGASQHMAGCSGAKNIIAINKDSEANIFKECRYGVGGDWKEVLPSFIQTVKELVS
ncbi:MAG: electron transfer flavoprotein subunit alpha/FixB family protein [Chloroflexi bacterium]|nr:electron transfer flavoprotein subunit alpha/FixB family protein [Chloroflexota bacterium]